MRQVELAMVTSIVIPALGDHKLRSHLRQIGMGVVATLGISALRLSEKLITNHRAAWVTVSSRVRWDWAGWYGHRSPTKQTSPIVTSWKDQETDENWPWGRAVTLSRSTWFLRVQGNQMQWLLIFNQWCKWYRGMICTQGAWHGGTHLWSST